MSSNLIDALRYIDEHSNELFKYDSFIIMNEVKRIMDSKDEYYIDSLHRIIKKECDVLIWDYFKSHIKYRDDEYLYNCDTESLKKVDKFWKTYREFHLKDTHRVD
jgi:hypothetical protein